MRQKFSCLFAACKRGTGGRRLLRRLNDAAVARAAISEKKPQVQIKFTPRWRSRLIEKANAL